MKAGGAVNPVAAQRPASSSGRTAASRKLKAERAWSSMNIGQPQMNAEERWQKNQNLATDEHG
jgi:hypothetical protein